MATSTWRMNGLYRKMTEPLVLCTLFLSSVVICQDSTPASASNETNATILAHTPSLNASVASSDDGALGSLSTIPDKLHVDPGNDNDNTMMGSTINPFSSSPASSSSNSSVFVGILVSGLLAALGITVGYCYCQRRTDTKGVKLTDEAYPADQENQGSTLASVAPLIPSPETQEKPSVNGESPEAAKTQPPPPTNGHSTTKTADTEL